jgi:hypothetical protein
MAKELIDELVEWIVAGQRGPRPHTNGEKFHALARKQLHERIQ